MVLKICPQKQVDVFLSTFLARRAHCRLFSPTAGKGLKILSETRFCKFVRTKTNYVGKIWCLNPLCAADFSTHLSRATEDFAKQLKFN